MISQEPNICFVQDFLYPYFEHKNYIQLENSLHFKRETSFGHVSVICNLTGEAGHQYLNFFLGIRHVLIETTLQGLTGVKPYFHNDSHTLIVDWRHLLSHSSTTLPQRQTISNQRQLEQACNVFIDFMDRNGFAFLEKYRSLSAIDQLYNNEVGSASIWCNHHYLMCFRGMLTALILRRPNIQLVYERHRKHLVSRRIADEILRKFDATFAHLGSLSLN